MTVRYFENFIIELMLRAKNSKRIILCSHKKKFTHKIHYSCNINFDTRRYYNGNRKYLSLSVSLYNHSFQELRNSVVAFVTRCLRTDLRGIN